MLEGAKVHPYRAELVKARRVVVKVGSGVLVGPDHQIDRARLAGLTESLARLRKRGLQVVMVTSGAVAAGAPLMGLAGKSKTIPQKQACAAIGQTRLMTLYERLFSAQGLHTAQVLLTQDDVRNRERYLNARNTLETLLSSGMLPIVNENDTVIVEEIKFGDNDNLSAQVSALVGADLLILLSTVRGLHAGPPWTEIRPLSVVDQISTEHFTYVQDRPSSSSISTGGMESKLLAIEKAGQYGVPAVLASGLKEGVVERILAGEDEGTLFAPAKDRLSARKHWILHSLIPQGSLTVDAGAAKALLHHGKSLLPIGVVAVQGDFRSGNAVRVLAPDGQEIARGLTHYNSEEAKRIQARRSEEIESLLGYRYYDELIHRDNLVLIGKRPQSRW